MKKPKLVAKDGKPVSKDKDAADFYRDMEVDVLARTMWGEARGQGDLGLQAVAHVVLNRVEHARAQKGFWWGNNIIQVCQKPYQFSCWNRSDPNYQKLLNVDERNLHFATCLRLARRAVIDRLGEDITKGATHYHADYVSPYWIKGEKPLITIGAHLFYRLTEV